LWWTLRALAAPHALPPETQLLELLVAARRDEFRQIEDVFAHLQSENAYQNGMQSTLTMRCIEGGDSRQASVHNATRAAQGDVLMVHDAARPLVAAHLIRRVLEAALHSGAAIAAMLTSDTVKLARNAGERVPSIAQTLDRRTIWLAQTPQVFRREVLLEAFEQAAATGFCGTDCASLIERLVDANGEPLQTVTLVEGDAANFKVTFNSDIERATMLLQPMTPEPTPVSSVVSL
jgi:2-C-methyl-D-erythritol 4-phosphate cytidylyltransferase